MNLILYIVNVDVKLRLLDLYFYRKIDIFRVKDECIFFKIVMICF